MANTVGETEVVEIMKEEERIPESGPPPPPPTDQPRTVVDITWDSSKRGQIFNVTESPM